MMEGLISCVLSFNITIGVPLILMVVIRFVVVTCQIVRPLLSCAFFSRYIYIYFFLKITGILPLPGWG